MTPKSRFHNYYMTMTCIYHAVNLPYKEAAAFGELAITVPGDCDCDLTADCALTVTAIPLRWPYRSTV